jgi:hypothetical protein
MITVVGASPRAPASFPEANIARPPAALFRSVLALLARRAVERDVWGGSC